MKTLSTHPRLRTSSMLFAESYPEHLRIYRSLFADGDIVLDVGCGPGGSDLQFDGIDTDHSDIRPDSAYNTLNFSESIGYLSLHEVISLLKSVNPEKVVIKDFICAQPVVVPYFNYNFQFFYTQIIPILVSHGYSVSLNTFKPHKERWKSLLAECGLQYHPAPGIIPCIGVFIKNDPITK